MLSSSFNLKEMTIEELKLLSKQIGVELINRIEESQRALNDTLMNTDQYKFHFESELRISKPYVARCYWKNGLERDFKGLPSQKNACIGDYIACEGEILDINGNDGRAYYIVHKGELKELCKFNDNMRVCRIKVYLKGQMTTQAFLEIMGIEEIESEIKDDLRDE